MKPEITELVNRIETEINKTPTGDLRNLLCDSNIVIQSSILVSDVIERLTAMKKNVELPEFDHSKKNDLLYVVEWGIAKGEWIADGIIDRYISELK